MSNQYEEIKNLLKKTRLLKEQAERINMAKSIENNISDDEQDYETADGENETEDDVRKDKSKSYRISGGLLTLHGKEKKDLELTSDEKTAYQETMDEFFSIGEENGVYINGDMIKLDEKLTELVTKLTSYYEKFKAKWAKVIAGRKKTQFKKEEEE